MLVDTPVGGGRPEVVRAREAIESVSWRISFVSDADQVGIQGVRSLSLPHGQSMESRADI
jgi:hypothetical protein